ncbi:MAG: DNA mismatch repair protein MutS [Bacteroidetes bacterium MedPE-SWsnd-G2]|nr:MAG: DNA mismatch repair protein MutS [Bacteroidetes bacterium MedPE-SWsnd-G2]
MENPKEFYNQQIAKYQGSIKTLYRQLTLYSSLRLITFILTAMSTYLFFGDWTKFVASLIIGFSVFLFLLLKHTKTKEIWNLHKNILQLNNDELDILNGNYQQRPEGKAYLDPSHFYSHDIDLFGKGSLYQFINRTQTKDGSHKLALLLTQNSIDNILNEQQAIKALSTKQTWSQNYAATAKLIQVETEPKLIIHWLSNYKPFLAGTQKWLPIAFTMLSIIAIILVAKGLIFPSILMYWLILGLAITGKYLKKINALAQNTSQLKDTFKQYSKLLHLIEENKFESSLLQAKQQLIQAKDEKASIIFKKLSKAMDALDNRNNLISAVFGNGYFLWDLYQSYRIERWIMSYGNKVEQWIETVAFFDAYNSFGTFAFNHPNYTYPKLTDNNKISISNLGHPLLPIKKRICNDVNIDHHNFLIVTGANMAGKSTFLRTISLHIIMANCGLPVCAEHSIYHPIKLITSMRTTDSLTDDSSYFFSELTRLKFIVDALETDRYFVILDEILKGTNSTDKAIGSKKFVEKLAKSEATGIIATHDLSLCDITEQLEPVHNYYFDAQIQNDELSFDYKLKPGICQNMNASFLLKKMQII